jgi:hypothetical protein
LLAVAMKVVEEEEEEEQQRQQQQQQQHSELDSETQNNVKINKETMSWDEVRLAICSLELPFPEILCKQSQRARKRCRVFFCGNGQRLQGMGERESESAGGRTRD